MKKISKIISIILTLVMVVSIIPMSTITASATTYSGTCGDELTWEFDESTGTLTISGYGWMYDYDYDDEEYSPWVGYSDKIKNVVIEDDVLSIGDCAFANCIFLTSVSIGNSVTSIGKMAFANCQSLTSVEIPDSVTWIYYCAFGGCINLTNVVIPNSINGIADEAFAFCEKLTSVTIPNSVTTIGNEAFMACTSLTSVIIGEGVSAIGSLAFASCTSLTSVTILGNITKFGEAVFVECENLTEVIIGEGVTTISATAFLYCTGLTNITIPNSVTTIGVGAFAYCENLTSITIPNSVKTIGEMAFYESNNLTDVYYLGTQEQWNSVIIGSENTPLSNATIHFNEVANPSGICGDNLTWEFDTFTGKLTISGVGEMYNYEYDYDNYCANYPWKNYRNSITTLEISEGVTTIGEYAFAGCIKLTNVTIPDSVTTIGNWAFAYCENITDIIIPNSVKTIGIGAFVCCTSLTSVIIPNSVTTLDYGAFSYCHSLMDITVDGSNQFYSSDENGVLFNKDKTTLIQYPVGNTRTDYEIPDSVITIEIGAFAYCTNLAGIMVPNSVALIGEGAFDECTNLICVYYHGTYDEWIEISIENYNSYLEDATIYYNGHSFSEWIIEIQPTCTESGLGKSVCYECGKENTISLAPIGHEYGDFSVDVAPTCSTEGSESQHCSRCDSKINETPIPATGQHNLTWHTLSVASCQTDGVQHGYCDNCSYYEVKITPSTGHVYETVITEPTCTEDGYTTHTCTCGDTHISDETPATGHADNDDDGYCDACDELLDPTKDCSCNCHKSGISKFFFNFALFFQKIFGSNKECACGLAHY